MFSFSWHKLAAIAMCENKFRYFSYLTFSFVSLPLIHRHHISLLCKYQTIRTLIIFKKIFTNTISHRDHNNNEYIGIYNGHSCKISKMKKKISESILLHFSTRSVEVLKNGFLPYENFDDIHIPHYAPIHGKFS